MRVTPVTPQEILGKVQVTASGCWLWTGRISAEGYGYLTREGGSNCAHVIAYEMFRGQVPQGHHLDHTCHSFDETCAGGPTCPHRRCVNPDHLEPVTPWENWRRSNATSAINARKTHCVNGHEFTPENTRIRRSGRRECRSCSRQREKRRWANGETRRRPAARVHQDQ